MVVREDSGVVAEYSLNRIKTVSVAKSGVSFSSDLLVQCAMRGIKFFVLDFRGQAVACLSGVQQHAMANVRKAQFRFMENESAKAMCAALVFGKLRNQRAVLLYFNKHVSKKSKKRGQRLTSAAEAIKQVAATVKQVTPPRAPDWRSYLIGHEGQGARVYWQALREGDLLPPGFEKRAKRGAKDLTNVLLNYGYAVLSSYVWHCVINAGLEAYVGCLHANRPGKPSLVLDIMEEYRPWTVDRIIVKHRGFFSKAKSLKPAVKKKLVESIHRTFDTRYPYKCRKYRLETILQKQVYSMAGSFTGQKVYRPYLFRW